MLDRSACASAFGPGNRTRKPPDVGPPCSPNVAASRPASVDAAATLTCCPSIALTASSNAVPFQAGTPGLISGRQRRHGLKPAEYAAAAVGKITQFSNLGVRAGQMGRQKMPVDKTPVKKRPSNRRSRAATAR